MREELAKIVIDAVASLNDSATPNLDLDAAATALYGPEGFLDSIGLVSLIVAVEQAIEDAYGVTLVLASEKAMSRRNSPFATVATLVQAIEDALASEVRSHG